MKLWAKNAIALACASLNACAMSPFPGEPAVHKMIVQGQTYALSQLTASTWTATAAANSKAFPGSAIGTAELRQVIEKMSGCKVTDSDYSRQGRQFDAQVDCGGLSR